LPQDYDHADSQWAINRMVNEAINLATQSPAGPVHINAPFREPLYPQKETGFNFSESVRVLETFDPEITLSNSVQKELSDTWKSYQRILVVAGQAEPEDEVSTLLKAVADKHGLPVVGDILSNLHSLDSLIRHSDLFLGQAPESIRKSLQPDLLITFGQSVISKNLKLFLRQYPAKDHWHIQPSGVPADTYQHLTRFIPATPGHFLQFLQRMETASGFELQKQKNYQNLWEIEERKALRILREFFPQDYFGELELVKEILNSLPEGSNLHLANSMSVRYANFIGLRPDQKVQVYSNRGTSGIDGCVSTAVGHSLSSNKPNILITGDMAFFYDRNAFWNNYPVPNLHVVVLNNHGGTIFNMIDGPSSLPESQEYFVTNQKLSARSLCQEFGFDYLVIDNKRKIKNTIKDFIEFEGTTKILELETDGNENKLIFDKLKQKIKTSYEL
jgi:2-succinyl-5-enolpyruvyl-6-hydroxy-3-cyclohexene-1-carboxylate synthase